ncbi:hypothetical protein GW17_00026280 [Ensete ventricosum]|nr:hypothetical protein GW17_00026280 [Ensete ventricosum]
MKHRSRDLLLSKFYFFIRNAIFGRRTPPLPTCPPPSQTNRQKEHLPRNSWRCGQQRTSRSCHIPVKNPPTPFLTRMLLPPLPPLSFPYILGRSGQSSSSCRLNPPTSVTSLQEMGHFWTFLTYLNSLAGYLSSPLLLLVLRFDLYASVCAIESPSKLDDEQWLAYWILYSFLTLTEMVAEPILAW